ncbi:MAG: Gfo/Idh/MocA family oxidoreductase, partial [Planctomycetota bacterium]
GAALYLSPSAVGQTGSSKTDDINVALLGAGEQGKVLMDACMKMGKNSGIRFKAVCDIWAYNRNWVSRRLKAYRHENNTYVDYREMLDKEKDLDAVIVATPDFWHGEHTVACLKAGLHVYCEKEMSNTLDGAKKIAQAAKESGKLLQIGHQRRSNPRYIFCYEKLIKEAKLLNRITTANGQWNRSKSACEERGWGGQKYAIDPATLENYGFQSMQQLRNWRWYKGLGGGPIVDLGSHQIDIYNWFLDAQPKSIIASGGTDYWKDREWYDNVMAIYEYETAQGTVRAFYQTLTTNSSQGYFEIFMGDEGTLVISEASSRGSVYRESWVDEAKWDKWAKKGYLKKDGGKGQSAGSSAVVDVRDTVPAAKYDLPVTMDKPFHQPHLENFFDAIRGKAKLNCPAEIGYETAVTVLKVNEAVQAGRKLDFKPEEFA